MEKWRDDPDYEIDNNFAERAARPVAMHRKTQNHVASHKGAEASCILRSLIETCKLWKVSVCEYLNRIFTAFSVGRTDYENLMPWCMPSLG
ncbi:MAG: transposase [Muribaculaceae bacterium]|nr:transposase [Muribaculaceae bacterium]